MEQLALSTVLLTSAAAWQSCTYSHPYSLYPHPTSPDSLLRRSQDWTCAACKSCNSTALNASAPAAPLTEQDKELANQLTFKGAPVLLVWIQHNETRLV